MGFAVVVARLVVACTLAFAASAKWRAAGAADRAHPAQRLRSDIRDDALALGAPSRLAAIAGRALLPAELVVAVLLVVPGTARLGGALAALLVATFTVLIVRTLRSGRRPRCHCFGNAGAAPIGATTLARNVALLALAVVAALPS